MNWEEKWNLDLIAAAIGRHFWQCETENEAIRCGMDCAKEVMDALRNGIDFSTVKEQADERKM